MLVSIERSSKDGPDAVADNEVEVRCVTEERGLMFILPSSIGVPGG